MRVGSVLIVGCALTGAALALLPAPAHANGATETRRVIASGARALKSALTRPIAVPGLRNVAVNVAPVARQPGQVVIGIMPRAATARSKALGVWSFAEGNKADAGGLAYAQSARGRAAGGAAAVGEKGAVSLGAAYTMSGPAVGTVAHADLGSQPGTAIGLLKGTGNTNGVGVLGVGVGTYGEGYGLLVGGGHAAGAGLLYGEGKRRAGALNWAYDKVGKKLIERLP